MRVHEALQQPYLVPAGAVVVVPPGEGGVPDGQLLPDAPESDHLGPPGAGEGGVVTVLGVAGGLVRVVTLG